MSSQRTAPPERSEYVLDVYDKNSLSFIRGGPVCNLLKRAGLTPSSFRAAVILSIVLAGFCLLPTIVLSAIDGKLLGGNVPMPLLGDVATLGRFLVALPALILIAPDNDGLLRRTIGHFLNGGLIKPEDRAAFGRVIASVLRLRDTIWPELFIFMLALTPALLAQEERPFLKPIESWHFGPAGELTLAGMWLEYAAKPVYLLVTLLWVWRLILWTILLRRICRLDLNLYAAHPDGTGGLGFLPAMQQRFSKFSFAGGVIIAGASANEILYHGATLEGIGWLPLTYIVVTTMLMCAPLIVLVPCLVALKRRGILAYGALGNEYLRAFEAKWFAGPDGMRKPGPTTDRKALEELGSEYGTLTDLNAAYVVVQNLSIVPITKNVLIAITLPAILPLVPVVFLALGAQELLVRLFALLK